MQLQTRRNIEGIHVDQYICIAPDYISLLFFWYRFGLFTAMLLLQVFLLLLPVCCCKSPYHWLRTEIHVEQSVQNDAQCCPDNVTMDHGRAGMMLPSLMLCSSLNKALHCLQVVGNYTLIYLPNGVYTLTNSSETEIANMSHVSILGESNEDVNISCDYHTQSGLSFVHSTNITLENFTIYGCSQPKNSTSLDYSPSVSFAYLKYEVSIYMLFCVNVSITGVTVTSSGGNGMTMYNVGGTVLLSNCFFINNKKRPGGGGLQIEFSYCIPGDISCKYSKSSQIGKKYSSGISYTINNCQFIHNVAYRGYRGLRKLSNVGNNSFSFGHGGGLAVILKGNASYNFFVLQGCSFFNNIGHMGGGVYVSFHDNASNNGVLINNSVFEGNEVIEKVQKVFDVDGGGGGAKIIFDNGEHGNSSNNLVIIKSSSFSRNIAISGGGMWIETNLHNNSFNYSIAVFVENCKFFNNSAFLGSGVYLSSGFKKATIFMMFTDVDFVQNSPKCSQTLLHSFLPCSGILYTINIPFSISGSNVFMYNSASAIEVHEADIKVIESSTVRFKGNVSPYGPSIALYGCSYLEINIDTKLTFIDNKALSFGGAIYAGSCSGGSQPADASSECFIQYHDREAHPNHWNTTLTFCNNSDSVGNNSLFAVSMSACWWPGVNETFIYTDDHYNNLCNTFCWAPWHYDVACHEAVHSGPAFLTLEKDEFIMLPGDHIQLPEVRDGSFIQITKVFIVCIAYGPASFAITSKKICNKYHKKDLKLYFHNSGENSFYDNHTVHINIKLDGAEPGGFFEPSFDLKFKGCTFPYEFNGTLCLYIFDYFCCSAKCELEGRCGIGSSVTPKPQYCVANNSGTGVLIGPCPLSYNGRPTYSRSISNHTLSDLYCANGHSGILCGGCEPQLGVPMNSLYYQCVECRRSRIPGLLWFILLELVPVSLFIAFIIIFNVNLTGGVMIGFIFYCQIISVNFPVWVYPTWLTYLHPSGTGVFEANSTLERISTIAYKIFNLDFLTPYDPVQFPICIFNHMNPFDVIVFEYVVPFYCLLVLSCLTVWLVMYERGVSGVVRLTRPFHKCLARFWSHFKINPSLIESLASFYILCFTPLAATSLKLLHFTRWQSMDKRHYHGKSFFYNAEFQYFGFPHAFTGLFAIFVLIFFCFIPAIFLVLYPYQIFHKVIEFIKLRHQVLITFADINTGSFCDGSKTSKDFRSFAGLYLFLRLVIMCFYYIPGQHFVAILYLETITSLMFGGIIMIFRPFKRTVVNFINFAVFALLGAMSGVCLAFQSHVGRLVCLVFLMHLPFIFALFSLIHYLRKKCIAFYKKTRKTPLFEASLLPAEDMIIKETTAVADESDRDTGNMYNDTNTDDWPDRLENPDDYDHNVSRFRENQATIPLINETRNQGNYLQTYGSAI